MKYNTKKHTQTQNSRSQMHWLKVNEGKKHRANSKLNVKFDESKYTHFTFDLCNAFTSFRGTVKRQNAQPNIKKISECARDIHIYIKFSFTNYMFLELRFRFTCIIIVYDWPLYCYIRCITQIATAYTIAHLCIYIMHNIFLLIFIFICLFEYKYRSA